MSPSEKPADEDRDTSPQITKQRTIKDNNIQTNTKEALYGESFEGRKHC